MKQILTLLLNVPLFPRLSKTRARLVPRIRSGFLFVVLFFPPLVMQQGCAPMGGVPEGERTSVVGTVQDVKGQPVRGVEVKILNLETRSSRTMRTDANGEFEISGIPPGKYAVATEIAGVPVIAKEITVAPGRTAAVALSTGGPVPEGERNKSTRTVEVVELTFQDELALQTWINDQAKRGKRLQGVIPVQYKTSLFVLESSESGVVYPDLVQRVSKPLRGNDLVEQITSHVDKTFVGLHRVDDNSYFMVWRYGRP